MGVTTAYAALSQAEGIRCMRDVPLAQHTTYRIGGPADLLVFADSLQGLMATVRTCAESGVEWVVLGRGSNILAADEGFRGCVIVLGREFTRMSVDGCLITAGAAVMLPRLVNETLTRELSGLEACAGIPGTVGGALSMDAGSRHEWIGRVVRDVVSLSPTRGMRRHMGADIEWGYRWCSLPRDEIILEATFELTSSTRESIALEMNRRMARRRATQPVGRPCCGSVFKNPGDRSVGALLDACGLKGARSGGACVSDAHANFIVNEGGAQAADVVALMRRMHDAVRDQFGIELVPEVKLLGFEG